MKTTLGVSLLMMVLVGCTAPAQLSTPSNSEVFMPGVTIPRGSPDAVSGIPQVEAAGQMEGFVAGFPPATADQSESMTAAIADADIAQPAVRLAAVDRAAAFEANAAIPPQNEPEETPGEIEDIVEYDPWERFNEKMFRFNRQVDRFVLKPVATLWDTIVPDLVQQSLSNAFENVTMPRRLVNNILQLNEKGAARELARFFINTTMGVGGFFDAASELGIEKSDKDTGQTLGVYGVGPGPYLVLPFLPPLTVRDGIGFGIDGALDPLTYVSPFAATAGRTGGKTINDRSLNLELFEEFEASTLDLYAAVRSAYLERRRQAIAEAIAERR